MAGRPASPRPVATRRRIALGLGLALLALLALLAWAQWRAPSPASSPPAHPALWRISAGPHHAWVFGTIHAVPRGAQWLGPALSDAVADSDRLMLEVTGLAQERQDRQVFETLGRSPGLPPVAERLDPPARSLLAALRTRSGAQLDNLDAYESWAAALLIGAVATHDADASSQGAGEAQMEQLFRADGRPVLGLETIAEQLGLFDSLPADAQHVLLDQAVREAGDARALFDALYRAWAQGDIAALEAQFLAPLAAYPALREALMDQRNIRWADKIDSLLRSDGDGGVAFIAVGVGHLAGDTSLLSALENRGWRVERVQ